MPKDYNDVNKYNIKFQRRNGKKATKNAEKRGNFSVKIM